MKLLENYRLLRIFVQTNKKRKSFFEKCIIEILKLWMKIYKKCTLISSKKVSFSVSIMNGGIDRLLLFFYGSL